MRNGRILTWLLCIFISATQLVVITIAFRIHSSSFHGEQLKIPIIPILSSINSNEYTSTLLQMKVRIGILGLPNVGKSSLFNSLVKKSLAEAANYPFCTIEPNKAYVPVPSMYLESLKSFEKCREKTIAATIQFIDVAGLAKNAHRGEGLGNQFLATLRECNALVHVIRTFDDSNVVHVSGTVDPVSDAIDINLELILADMEHIQRRLDKITSCKDIERNTLEKILLSLQSEIPARAIGLNAEEIHSIKSMGLLTLKPVLYAFNVDEIDFILDRNEITNTVSTIVDNIPYYNPLTDMYTIVSAKVESDLITTTTSSDEQLLTHLQELGAPEVDDTNIDKYFSYNTLPIAVCKMLGLYQVYTGLGVPIERSRTIKAHIVRCNETTADDLASRLHKDIQKGFIRAEVIHAKDLLQQNSFITAKDSGIVRNEGRDYILQDNDVVLIKWKGG